MRRKRFALSWRGCGQGGFTSENRDWPRRHNEQRNKNTRNLGHRSQWACDVYQRRLDCRGEIKITINGQGGNGKWAPSRWRSSAGVKSLCGATRSPFSIPAIWYVSRLLYVQIQTVWTAAMHPNVPLADPGLGHPYHPARHSNRWLVRLDAREDERATPRVSGPPRKSRPCSWRLGSATK